MKVSRHEHTRVTAQSSICAIEDGRCAYPGIRHRDESQTCQEGSISFDRVYVIEQSKTLRHVWHPCRRQPEKEMGREGSERKTESVLGKLEANDNDDKKQCRVNRFRESRVDREREGR